MGEKSSFYFVCCARRGPDDVHITYFRRRKSPTTAGVPAKLNSAQLSRQAAVNAWDRLLFGDKCSHMSKQCPRYVGGI